MNSEERQALEAEADRALAAGDLASAARSLQASVALAGAGIDSWMKLAGVRRALGRLDDALDAVSGALRIDPLAFLPLLMRAGLLERAGRGDEAGEAASVAIFHAPPPERLPAMVRAELDRARTLADRHVAARAVLLANLAAPAMAAATPAERRRIERFQDNVLRRTRAYHQAPSHFHFPGLPGIEYWDRDEFPFLAALEAETDAIRAEFEAVLKAEAAELEPYVQYPDDVPLAQWEALNHSRQWTAIHLWRLGEKVAANARHCPRTMAFFDAVDQPRVAGRSPNLMFSLLAPRTHIPAHTGVSNTRLIFHLPLIVPDGCRFRVGGETRAWREGEAFVFDDTIEHEAWNDSDRLRVVLIGDLWQPRLSVAERAAADAILAEAQGPIQHL